MSKTAPIPDDIHELIIDEQTRLKRQYKITVKISDIIAVVMKNNIHKVGEYLGIYGVHKKTDSIHDKEAKHDPSDITLLKEIDVET